MDEAASPSGNPIPPPESEPTMSAAGEASATSPAPSGSVGISDEVEDPIDALDAWFHQHIHDSVYSRNTLVYNRIVSAYSVIRAELIALA